MANVLKPKRSNVAGNIPTTTNLASGEMGVNMADRKVWINNGTSVVQIGSGRLSGLADVVLSSLATGQGLSWNGTNWVNSSAGSGTVTSVSGTGTVSGLTLSGSVTGSGSLTLGGTLSLTSGQVTTALGFTPYNSTNPSGYITGSGNAATATALQTARTINGVSFNGTANITVADATKLPLTGGTLTGPIEISTGATNNSYNEGLRLTAANNGWAGITFGSTGLSGTPTNGWFAARNPSNQFIVSPGTSDATVGLTLNSGGNALWRNSIILNAGNVSSYSPSLAGSGASGTWGISVTGSANSLNLSGHTISNNSWAGGGGYHGYQFNGGNWRFGFSSTGGVVDVYADGNFYATDSSHLVLHVGNISSYAISSSGGTISGNNFIDFGPNSTWGATLRVGGNGHGGATRASVATTNGNLHLDGTTNSGVYLNWYNSGTAGAFFGNGAGGQVGRVDGGGNATFSGNVSGASDERLKTDWEVLPADYIERLAKVKSGTYTRLDSGARQAGASAQDMQKLLRETVMTADDEAGTLSLAYGNAALVSAIELAKDNVDLRARVAKLEALVSKLIEG